VTPSAELPDLETVRRVAGQIGSAISQVVLGKPEVVRLALIALLAEGHLLIEDVPGTGKTVLAKSLARTVDATVSRVQFTPDLMPSDVTGVSVYDRQTSRFDFRPGPVFANIVVADEINRASPKTQSALLECMEERQVTVDGTSYRLARPFLVLATQNPIETEGTYPLPEAQVDRFMLKVLVGYPSTTEEFVIVERMTSPAQAVQMVLTSEQLLALQQQADRVYVDPALIEYAVRMVTATRTPKAHGLKELERYVMFGASPRASINLILAARALAFVRGRNYALPQDVRDLALDVMRHRLVLSYEALSDNVSADEVLTQILGRIAQPEVPLHEYARSHTHA
jgi:MoxR-like ATPase